jgi:hypothetical protein
MTDLEQMIVGLNVIALSISAALMCKSIWQLKMVKVE